jgi:hypothetical protein
MDEPILLSKGNLVVAGKNPGGKPFQEGGNAFILNPNHECGVLSQFVLGGKKMVCHKESREREILTQSVGNEHAIKSHIHHCCLLTMHATD